MAALPLGAPGASLQRMLWLIVLWERNFHCWPGASVELQQSCACQSWLTGWGSICGIANKCMCDDVSCICMCCTWATLIVWSWPWMLMQ